MNGSKLKIKSSITKNGGNVTIGNHGHYGCRGLFCISWYESEFRIIIIMPEVRGKVHGQSIRMMSLNWDMVVEF